MIYFDHASATPVDPEVLEVMLPFFSEHYANPSSLHLAGQKSRAAVDKARMKIAEYLGVQPTEVYFCASGTESCNWALVGVMEPLLLRGQQAHLIVSEIEHSAVLGAAKFLEESYATPVTYLPVDKNGRVSPEDLRNALRPDTALVSIMTVNNEIGTVQPIRELSDICKENGVLMHTDACQAIGFIPLDIQELGVDLLTINASKIYGPKGIGALYVRESISISSWTKGGPQEFKKRAGTENVSAIVGFEKAVELANRHYKDLNIYVTELRDTMWKRLQESISEIVLNGEMEHRAPNNLNIWIKGVDGETLVKRMDLAGFAFSTGSACTSGEVTPSHVLMGIGRDIDAAKSSIRITLGKGNNAKEVQQFIETLTKVVDELRKA